MLAGIMSGYVRLAQVMSGDFRLGQVNFMSG
jgi:hypothetical protein